MLTFLRLKSLPCPDLTRFAGQLAHACHNDDYQRCDHQCYPRFTLISAFYPLIRFLLSYPCFTLSSVRPSARLSVSAFYPYPAATAYKHAATAYKHAATACKHAAIAYKHAATVYKHAATAYKHAATACKHAATAYKPAATAYKHAAIKFKHIAMIFKYAAGISKLLARLF